MNIIPKFQLGGGLDSFFVEYQPMQRSRRTSSSSRGYRSSSKSTDDDEKGKLTEKDFFTMIKDIDGLPNEMAPLIKNLVSSFQLGNLTGDNIDNLSTTYLLSLYKIKLMAQNKTQFDEVVKNALLNGAMYEPAITPDGGLMVLTKDGGVHAVDLDTYFNNKDKYNLLTVSNIAYLRKYDSEFSYDPGLFEVINNGVGFESFLKLIDSAKANLLSVESERDGYFSVEGLAYKGLKLLETLLKNDLVLALGSVTAEGLYKYNIIDKDNLLQIKALTTYLSRVLPNRVKTWAALKSGTSNKEKATEDIIMLYLLRSREISHKFNISYQDTTDNTSKTGKTGKGEDPKEGFWRLVQAGRGGTESSYNIIIGKGSMSLSEGKYYGTTPGPELNCSLGDYISKSGLGYLRTSKSGITFGNIEISPDSFDDVMVNTRSGAYAVTLPIKNGKIWLEAVEVYNNFKNDLKKSGLKEGTNLYNLKVRELLKNPEYLALASLILDDGKLNPNNSAHFLVLEGVTSDKASGISSNGNKQNISDFNTNFIVNAGDDKELYRTLKEGLSSKERGEYDLDYNEFWDVPSWFGSYDKLYKGNIYIPLNTNAINAMNADENEIKEATSKQYEEMLQEWTKDNNKNTSRSDVLWQ